jgi:citrate lyase gamma subunit
MFPLEDALNTPAAKEKLDSSVKLYFGNQNHPKVAKVIGEWGTNKKTNAFNKSDKEACEWVFLSAILSMQERARSEGSNAIINIKSNYKSIETSSETEYMCGAGAVIAGVAFKGEFVKLAK